MSKKSAIYRKSFKGAQNDYATEKLLLEDKMNWEYKYQKKNIKGKIKKCQELYYNSDHKPFLIWWMELPKKSKSSYTSIEGTAKNYNFGLTDSSEVALDATYSLFLEFAIHNNNSTTVSFSVLENENLNDEIKIAKDIANSLNVYAGPIDLILLAKRTKKPDDYFFADSLNQVQIQFPQKVNVLNFYYKQSLMVSFPELQNVYNAASILWQYRTDSTTFDEFIAERRKTNKIRGIVTNICDSANIKRDFYIGKNPYFHCQDVYMQSEKVFCFINFTATEKTYDFNLGLFNDLVNNIKLK